MIIRVQVKAKSKIEQCFVDELGVYHIHTKEPAQENKANFDIIRILSQHFKTPQRNITFKSGITSKIKTLEVKTE